MKNVKLLLVFLLIVNCTAEMSDDNLSESLNPQVQNCVDALPNVRITNNGTHNFDFRIVDTDYTELHNESVLITTDSDWIELDSDEVVIVASNSFDYGQKAQIVLNLCDNIEIEIDVNNTLIVN